MKKSNHIQTAIRYHNIIFLVVACLVVLGFYSMTKMNKDEFPQFTIRQGVVAAVYPGASAQEVEEQVTKPLENFLFTYAEIDKAKTHSVSENGIVYVFAELKTEVMNKDEVWSKIRHGLTLFKKTSLPAGVLEIVVVDDFGNTSSMLLAVESPERTPRELEHYADQINEKLRTIKSMGNLKVLGQRSEEIAVLVDQEKLAAYGISQRTLLAELATQGFRTIGGTVENQDGEAMVHLSIPYQSEYEVGEQIIYADPSGNTVRLRDIAKIERRYAKAKNYVNFDEEPAVIVSMEMAPGNNIVAFGREVEECITIAKQQLPPDVQVHKITNQPKVVNDSVLSFLRDLLISILVIVVVMLLLFPLRTALVASTSVPVCTAITLGFMYLFGIELNTVTLAALIVVLGLIVDDSVIIIDGYVDYLNDGYSRGFSAVTSSRILFVPMSLATLAISGMFFPMTKIIKGPLGEFVQLFPWTITFALVASIFYAVWVIPYLSTRFIKRRLPDEKIGKFEKAQNWFFDFLQSSYDRILESCFRHPALTILASVSAVGIGVVLFLFNLDIQMLPKADRNCFAVEIHLAEGSTLDQTAAIADSLSDILRKDKRVTGITSFVGCASPRFHATYAPQMAKKNYAQFIVNTTGEDDTRALIKEYGPQYEHFFPNAYARFKQMDYQAVGNPIEIRFSGDDLDELKRLSDSLKNYLNTLPELTWVHSDLDECSQNIKVVLNSDEATRLGVTQSMLSIYLSSALGGQALTSVWEDDYKVPVMLYSLQEEKEMSCQDLEDLMIPTSIPGTWVPLRQVASVEPEWHDANICRRNSVRTVTVSADLRYGVSEPGVFKRIRKYVDKEFASFVPENVDVQYGGLSEANDSVIPQIVWSVLAAVLVLFVFLLYHFHHIKLVFLNISASLICIFGATVGLSLFGLDFSITAVLGLVSLIGIIVRNGIIMFEYAELLRHDNHLSAKEAAFEAGKRRLRPIFLTSAAAALGVVPMIIAHTSLWMPMGVVICFGTIFSFPFVVTLLPVAYWQLFERNDKKINLALVKHLKKHVLTMALVLCVTAISAQTLSLDSCKQSALRHNSEVQNAALDVTAAREMKKQALTKYFPNVSALAGGYHALNPLIEYGIDDIGNAEARQLLHNLYFEYGAALGLPNSLALCENGLAVGVTAVQPVFMGGQIVNGNKLASVGIVAAQLQSELTREKVLQQVEENYWLTVSLYEKKKTLQQAILFLDTLSRDVQVAKNAGLVTQNDQLKVKLKYHEMQSNLLKVNNGIALSTMALCQLTGIDYSPDLMLCDTVSDGFAVSAMSDEHAVTAVANRKESRLLGLQVEAEQLRKKMTVGSSLPQLMVGGGASYGNLVFDNYGANGLAFVTLQVPLTNWWENAHKIKQQNVQIQKAENMRDDLMQKMLLETQQAFNNVQEAAQQVQLMKLAVQDAHLNLETAKVNFEAGLIPVADLLEAQTLFRQSQDLLVDARIDYRVKMAKYERVTK